MRVCDLQLLPFGLIDSRLQMFVDRLVDKFVSANQMQRQYDRVKLHLTVLNTLFRRDPNGMNEMEKTRNLRERESFNAKSILQVLVNALPLSLRSFLICGVITSVADFYSIFVTFFWSRSPRLLQQPQSVFEGTHFCRL